MAAFLSRNVRTLGAFSKAAVPRIGRQNATVPLSQPLLRRFLATQEQPRLRLGSTGASLPAVSIS